jgi:hypothetical protein
VQQNRRGDSEAAWAWKTFRLLEGKVELREFCAWVYFFVTPLLGIAALVVAYRARRIARAWWWVGIGAFTLLAFFGTFSGSDRDLAVLLGGNQILGTVMTVGVLAGLWAIRREPGARVGYVVAGIGGIGSLLSAVLPITPDPATRGRTDTTQVSVMLEYFGADELTFPVLLGGLVGAASIVGSALAVSLLLPAKARARARYCALFVLGTLGAGLLLPVILLPERMESSALFSVAMTTLGFVGLRFYPAIGLAAVGLGELALHGAGKGERPAEAPAQEADVAACSRSIRSHHERMRAGAMTGDAFLREKLRLIRTAVAAARAQGTGDELVALLKGLVETGAVNAVELASVRQALAAPAASG